MISLPKMFGLIMISIYPSLNNTFKCVPYDSGFFFFIVIVVLGIEKEVCFLVYQHETVQ